MQTYLWKNLTLNPSPSLGKGWGEGAKCSQQESHLPQETGFLRQS